MCQAHNSPLSMHWKQRVCRRLPHEPVQANPRPCSNTKSPASKEQNTASITPTPTPTIAASCRPNWSSGPHTGTFRAAVLFVDFPDFPANTTISELYDPIASAPSSLFTTMSYGKLSLELVPILDRFFRMPSPSSSYDYSRALTLETHLRYINDALAAAGPSVSFSDIDTLYIIPPKFADEISFSTSTGVDVTAPDGSVISSTITFGQDLFFSWGPKTINHETGHALGLPDLYPYAAGEAVTKWVGGFDLMGLIAAQAPDLFAWHKWQLGWLEEEQVVCVLEAGVTEHRIGAIEVVDETREAPKAVAVPTSSTGYVMVEVRAALGADAGACGTGVLVYTADSALGSGEGPVRVIDSKPGSGGCGDNNGGELNDAPLQVGEELDTGLGVVVRVKAQEWNDFIVEVERK
ncbi:M6 metalloprotease [Bimuria novae-zelandiae CBS 107.79]|uniref:M6 metalloprotease n=1 Tax=Bimuria novae-zelandiae CBS 107.79 TaxID=1447943 RepID=A0A6A5UH70_9PLEO|nr:M6 metalloprotease [Bimuria novae-zelandiae CBS 107.79]